MCCTCKLSKTPSLGDKPVRTRLKEITNLGKHWILSILPLYKGPDKLMGLYINNLLNAISKDSSNFLEIKGEAILLQIFLKRLKKIHL